MMSKGSLEKEAQEIAQEVDGMLPEKPAKGGVTAVRDDALRRIKKLLERWYA